MDKNITVTIETTPEEIAEILFNMDNKEVAEVFKLWNNKFKQNWTEKRTQNISGYFIHSLYHFFLYVVKDLDANGKQFFKDAFSAITFSEIEYNYELLKKK